MGGWNNETRCSIRSRTERASRHRSPASRNQCRIANLRLSAAMASLGMLGALAAVPSELAYKSYELDVGEAEVQMLFTGQLTGPEANDLVVFTIEEGRARHATVYSHDGDTFSPGATAEVPADIVVLDTWESTEGTTLLAARQHGLDRFDPATGTFEPWLAMGGEVHEPINAPEEASSGMVFLFNFSRDLNDDGLDDIVYVNNDATVVRIQQSDGRLAEPAFLLSVAEPDLRSRYRTDSPLTWFHAMMTAGSIAEQLTERDVDYGALDLTGSDVAVPQHSLHSFDFDGDGHDDLVLPYFDRVEFFDELERLGEQGEDSQGEDLEDEEFLSWMRSLGGLWVHPSLEGNGWTENPVQSGGMFPSLSLPIPPNRFAVDDFNGDGVADLASHSIGEKSASKFDFHFGRRESGSTVFSEAPDTTVALKGWYVPLTELSDLDGDGDMDFCAVPIRLMGLGTMVGGLIRRSVRVELSCYLMADGEYPEEPSDRWRKRLPINAPAPETLADATGDGILDLVVPTRMTRLEVFPGTGDGNLFASKSIRVNIDLPKGGDALLFRDLNRDGKADMLVVPAESGKPVWVALSR